MFQCFSTFFACVIKHLKNNKLALKVASLMGVKCKALQVKMFQNRCWHIEVSSVYIKICSET